MEFIELPGAYDWKLALAALKQELRKLHEPEWSKASSSDLDTPISLTRADARTAIAIKHLVCRERRTYDKQHDRNYKYTGDKL